MSEKMSAYPIKWIPISTEEKEKKLKVFHDENSMEVDMFKSVPGGLSMPSKFVKQTMGERIYNFELRQDDVWIVTYPKCGTTWTQEILWQILNDLDLETAKSKIDKERVPFLEIGGLSRQHQPESIKKPPFIEDPITFADNMPITKPRVIKSHLPFEMLPPMLLDTCKVVYVCRNPKDAIVSGYKMHEFITPEMGDAPFGDFVDLVMDGNILYGSYWKHLKSGWSRKNHPNMKFIWFEDLKRDTPGQIKGIGEFLGQKLTKEQISTLCHSTNIDTMRAASKSLASDGEQKKFAEKFFRKGKVGNWTEYLEGEKLEQYNKWIEENLKGTDITIPFI